MREHQHLERVGGQQSGQRAANRGRGGGNVRRRCDQKQDKTANTHPADWFEMLLPSSISLIPVRDPMAAAIRARSSSVMLERTKSSASTEVSPACSKRRVHTC